LIKLFITDIDGCLLEAMKTPDWEVLGKVKSLNEQSEHNPQIPPLTLCTGRPMSYAEAIAQLMDIKRPLVFENAGAFHPEHYKMYLNGLFTEDARRQVDSLKKWLSKEIIPNYDRMILEFPKLMDAGVVHPEKEAIQQALPRVRAYVAENHPDFEVHQTDVSINAIIKGNDKRAGIEKLCELEGIEPSEVAYIGDTSGDIPGLKLVGRPFSPQNAIEEVKEVSKVLPGRATYAVLDAYQQVVQSNKET
jgi:HAD superfamily hydrolase (TIGR01484 family)